MLEIVIPAKTGWDEEKEEFVSIGSPITLKLEHSLLSISKWESKWHKPYVGTKEKTAEEILDYVRCMTVSPAVSNDVYNMLTRENMKAITDYIEDPMTATTIKKTGGKKGSGEFITSELIYYWMTSLNIPMECQKWHLNRLLTFIELCSIKNQPPKKMGKAATAKSNKALNAARRQKLNSSG